MTAKGNTESTARHSATNRRTNRASLSDRLTPLLISAGLVKGTIPTWMRQKLRAETPDTAFLWQVGDDAEEQKTVN